MKVTNTSGEIKDMDGMIYDGESLIDIESAHIEIEQVKDWDWYINQFIMKVPYEIANEKLYEELLELVCELCDMKMAREAGDEQEEAVLHRKILAESIDVKTCNEQNLAWYEKNMPDLYAEILAEKKAQWQSKFDRNYFE